MKDNTKSKKKLRLPQRSLLLYILLITVPVVVFFLIWIPVMYVNLYNENKVTPFETDIAGITDEIIYGDKNTITDFTFFVYCEKYNNSTGSATFRATSFKNENTDALGISNTVSFKLGLCTSWVRTAIYSSNYSTRRVANTPKEAFNSSTYYGAPTLSGLPSLPKKGGLPFVQITELPLYVYVQYTTDIKGTKTLRRYILKYEYDDYIIGSITFDKGTKNEYTVVATQGGK